MECVEAQGDMRLTPVMPEPPYVKLTRKVLWDQQGGMIARAVIGRPLSRSVSQSAKPDAKLTRKVLLR